MSALAPWETFAAAAVTGLSAVIVAVWQGRKTRAVNTSEHEDTKHHLLGLHRKVDHVRDRVEEHGERLDRIDKRLLPLEGTEET